jgi:hypothetical protein
MVFSVALGASVFATLILLCGLVGWLSAPVLLALFLIGAYVSRRELRDLPILITQSGSTVWAVSNRLTLVIFGGVAAWMMIRALSPSLDWDSLMYHLRVPVQFWEHGRIYLPEDNLHAAFVQLIHMLYIPLLACGSSASPALVNVFFALLLGLSVFTFCLRFFGSDVANISLSVLWGSTILLMVAVTPRVDVSLAFYTFLSHYLLILALTEKTCGFPFLFSGLLLGVAFGVKYQALAYLVALSPLVGWVAFSASEKLTTVVRSLSNYGLIALAMMVPWLVKNWLLLDAPLYPFLASPQLESWLTAFYPDLQVPRTIHPELLKALSHVRQAFNLFDLFFAPRRLTVEGEGVFHLMNPLLLSFFVWPFLLRKAVVRWLLIPGLGYLFCILFVNPYTNLRYLIPALIPLTLVTTCGIAGIVHRFLPIRVAKLLLFLLIILSLAPSVFVMSLWSSQSLTVPYSFGAVSQQEYLQHNDFPASPHALMDVVFYANRQLPQESRILLLLEARGYYFERPVLQDNVLTNWSFLAARGEALECLRAAKISHVLVNTGVLRYYVRRGLDPHILQWESFEPFAQRCLIPVYTNDAYTLYQVRQ